MSLKVWATLVSSELFRNLAHCLGTKKKNQTLKKWDFSIVLLSDPNAFWGILFIVLL